MSGPKTTNYAFEESQRQAAEREAQRSRELVEQRRKEEERRRREEEQRRQKEQLRWEAEQRREEERRRQEEERRRQEEERRHREEEERQRHALQTAILDTRERGKSLREAVRRAQTEFPGEGLVVQSSPPDEPRSQTNETLAAYLNELSQSVAQAETQLQMESQRVRASIAFREALVALLEPSVKKPRTVSEPLAVSPAPPTPTLPTETINRLMGRLEQEPGEALPPEIERLIEALQVPKEAPRHSALTMELRTAIIHHNENRKTQKRNREEAEALYLRLPDPRNEPERQLARRVSEAALGQGILDDPLRAEIQTWQTRAKTRTSQEQATEVMRQSLEALGYEVEEGFETLFVSGGLVHARKAGWDDYSVRLRVNPKEQSLNFNLVRTDDGTPPTQERRRRDREMEETWCPDYHRLRERLAAGGLSTKTLRETPAGTLAVQTIPASGTSHTTRHATALIQKSLNRPKGS